MTTPIVSVLMPAYNAEKYIFEAIDSVLSQTFTDFEFIIINDCSTDATAQIIESFCKKDSRIKYHSNKTNLGVAESLNVGLKLCLGKYIARMDADDIAMPSRLSKQVEFMNTHSEVIVCGSAIEIIDENGIFTLIRQYPAVNADVLKRLQVASPFAHPSVMINKEKLIKSGELYSTDYKYCEDYHLWFKLKEYGEFHNLTETLLKYRLSTSAIKASNTKRMLADTIRLKAQHVAGFYPKLRLSLEKLLMFLPAFFIFKLFICVLKGSHYGGTNAKDS